MTKKQETSNLLEKNIWNNNYTNSDKNSTNKKEVHK